MSGGHLDHQQSYLGYIADQLVLEVDQKRIMWYDQAVTRIGDLEGHQI